MTRKTRILSFFLASALLSIGGIFIFFWLVRPLTLVTPIANDEQVADMRKLSRLFEAGAGLEIPEDTQRLCILFVEESLDGWLYLRLDVDDAAKVRDLKWLQQSQPADPAAIYPGWGPTDIYPVPWWNLREITEGADSVRFVSPKTLDLSSMACVAERQGRASVLLVLPSELSRYSPELLALLKSRPIKLWTVMPRHSQEYGGCWRNDKSKVN